MDIMFKNYATGKVAYLPVVPPDIVIPNGLDVDEIDTLDGKTIKPNNRQLKKLALDSMFPVLNYGWVNPNANMKAYDYASFFNEAINKKQLLGVHVITKHGYYMLSMQCYVTEFSYSQDRVGDLKYSLEVTEYRDFKVVKV